MYNTITPINFKGYDVRPLKGFVMSCNPHNIASEMNHIGQKEGFKVYSFVDKQLKEEVPPKSKMQTFMWAQDLWTVANNKLHTFFNNQYSNELLNIFNLNTDNLQVNKRKSSWFLKEIAKNNGNATSALDKSHIPGGNFYVVKNHEKEDELLIGKDELAKYNLDEIKEIFNTKKVTVLPFMDYHIDLFVRPLENKVILLTDDNLSLKALRNGHKKISEFIKQLSDKQEILKYSNSMKKFSSYINKFEKQISANEYATTAETEKTLVDSGYKVIRVPGRLYELSKDAGEQGSFLECDCNYINANVVKNKKGELVYITNKSNIDSETLGLTEEMNEKCGFSFENAFKDSISDYINQDNIYFIKGEDDFVAKTMLKKLQGGIHCLCAEVPE